jgi:hypothetical protein
MGVYRLGAVASTAGDDRRMEAKTILLLAVGLTVLVFVAVPVWIRYGGAKQGPLPYIPWNPAVTFGSGEKIAFAASDLAVGDGVLCENHGVLVGAPVPKLGQTTVAQFVGSDWTATIKGSHAR